MGYIGLAILAIIVIGVAIYFFTKKKRQTESEDSQVVETAKGVLAEVQEETCLTFQMEMLPSESFHQEASLVEITDSKVLAQIDNLIPGLAQAGNAANNAVQAAAANGEVLYRAIIPAGAKLADSQAMEGAVRGFYRGADGIRGHANLVAVEAQKGTAVIANTAAAAMGVASMVVGQYYMNRINEELGEISDGISQITDFQDNEYRSRVFSLVSHVKTIADFQSEILENTELRIAKISQLDSLDEECTQLLGQASLTLAGFAEKKGLDYDSYERELRKAQSWYMYQRTLLEVLNKIAELRYTLHLGAVSREQCTALLPTYSKQVEEAQLRLSQWHQGNVKRLDIDTDETRRKRVGIDGAIHFLPGLFNDDLNFRSIHKSTATMIEEQSSSHEITYPQDLSELYDNDVQLISKDGKVYYLPYQEPEAE